MAKLIASIPRLGLTPKADDARELYILAFVSDLNIKENKEKDVIGAMNVTLPVVVPDIASQDALNFTLASVSNIFPVSRSKPNASLSGSGIMLYPNLDPKGFFALQIFIIESDDNHRRLGEKLEKILSNEAVKKSIDEVTGAITAPLIGGIMRAIASVVPVVFKNSIDDLMGVHSHSGFDFDNYGLDEGAKVAEFAFGDRKGIVEGVLRLRLTE